MAKNPVFLDSRCISSLENGNNEGNGNGSGGGPEKVSALSFINLQICFWESPVHAEFDRLQLTFIHISLRKCHQTIGGACDCGVKTCLTPGNSENEI